MTSRLGVLGWPVAHSRSPAMHNAALTALGLSDWRYQRLPVTSELFPETVRGLQEVGFVGANVTIPHKREALALADGATAAAREIGAANTLSFAGDGAITAANTDAPGLLRVLPRSPNGLSALVLGAGGSARAVVWALLGAGAREVAVLNRSPEAARTLAHELGARAVRRPVSADLLVNCTSVGLGDGTHEDDALAALGLMAHDLARYPVVVDLVYREGATALLGLARRQGAEVIDGLAVLVAQGALSLEMWTGREPPVEVMRRAAEVAEGS